MRIFILFLSMVLISSCDNDSNKSNWNINIDGMTPEENNGDWLIVHELSDNDGLNPYTSTGAGGTYIYAMNLFETLSVQDNSTLEFKPWIAKTMPKISKDNLTYTFSLREDVFFSDGKNLTGEDLIFSLKAIKNPFTDAAPSRNYYKDIFNAELVDGNPYEVRFRCSEVYFKHDIFITETYL